MLLKSRRGARRRGFLGHVAVTFAGTLLTLGCGSRSGLSTEEEVALADECTTDEDCARPCMVTYCAAGQCVTTSEVRCDDGDPCTIDTCDPGTDQCVFTMRTPDADGDGHHAPLPGFLPGEPGSCGDDCDDTSALAYPGNVERCDGRDNDCDGVVDNGAQYLTPILPEPVRVGQADLATSRGTGLAFGRGVFATSYGGRTTLSQSYVRGLDVHGKPAFEQRPLTNVNVMSFGAALQWSGNAFGATWADPRVDGNYEVYFSLFDHQGQRLSSDVRVSDARNFSIHPWMIHDAGRFVVVWDDRRDNVSDDNSAVYGQLIDNDGRLIGENRRLSPLGTVAEYPRLAAGERRFGLVYTLLEVDGVHLLFQSFDKMLDDPGALVHLDARDVMRPRIVALGDRFVVTWTTYGEEPGPEVFGVVLSEQGEILVGPEALTTGAEFARSHTTVSLGDRFVLLWTDTFDGNYELYAKTLSPGFEELEPRTRLTFDDADTTDPQAALSEDGTLGVLFDDWRSGSRQAYFTALGCSIAPDEPLR